MRSLPNTRLLIAIILLLSGSPGHAASPLLRFSFGEAHMGTWFQITLYAPDAPTATLAARAAFQRVNDLNLILSDYDPNSELMKLCAAGGGAPVRISEELFFVLSRAQEVARRSDGAFDVTIGPVVRLWRRARRTGQLPDSRQLAEARDVVGYHFLLLDPEHRSAQLLKAGMRLDLGGIAKGYAADEALAVLQKHSLNRALVAAGGDIVAGDSPPDSQGWKIAIARLGDREGKPTAHLVLHKAAVSTSGDTEQFVEIDGNRYSHIVDPRTGMGLTARASATVVAPKGIMADSLTKAAIILEPAKALQVIDGFPGAKALIVRAGPMTPETFVSPGFPHLQENENK